MKKLRPEDVSLHLLSELKYNYDVRPDEELKHIFLLDKKEFIVITDKRAVIHTGELHHTPKWLSEEIPSEFEENRLKNLEFHLEEEEKKAKIN